MSDDPEMKALTDAIWSDLPTVDWAKGEGETILTYAELTRIVERVATRSNTKIVELLRRARFYVNEVRFGGTLTEKGHDECADILREIDAELATHIEEEASE